MQDNSYLCIKHMEFHNSFGTSCVVQEITHLTSKLLSYSAPLRLFEHAFIPITNFGCHYLMDRAVFLFVA